MKLRDHPLVSYRGVQSWPPAWNSLSSEIKRHPKGEVGILKEVRIPLSGPFNRCFLVMEYQKSMYMGCLLIEDIPFCDHVVKLLKGHCGESLASIGSLDLSHTF